MAFVAAGSQRLHYVSNSDSERNSLERCMLIMSNTFIYILDIPPMMVG